MKPKRCTATLLDKRCTLHRGHSGNHTMIPPSGMDYAPDDEPGIEPERQPNGDYPWMPNDANLSAVAHNTALHLDCGQSDALDDLKDLILECVERAHKELLADARILAHAYEHDSRPPADVVRRCLRDTIR